MYRYFEYKITNLYEWKSKRVLILNEWDYLQHEYGRQLHHPGKDWGIADRSLPLAHDIWSVVCADPKLTLNLLITQKGLEQTAQKN